MKRTGFWLGIALFILVQLLPRPEDVSAEAWVVASLGLLMASWWITEAIPLPATGLLPLIVLPLMTDLSLRGQVAPPYMDPTILLLLGGFIIALAIERWNLHERIAYNIILKVGTSPKRLIAGFMIAAASLSMWISNTATTLMMVPIALSAAAVLASDNPGDETQGAKFITALLLGVCYAASIGGLGTIIGTPTNPIALREIAAQTGGEIDFVSWMLIGIPTVILLTPAAWYVVSRGISGAQDLAGNIGKTVEEKLSALGKISTPEWRMLVVFATVASLWIGSRWLKQIDGLEGLGNTTIAIMGAVAVFIIPSGAKKSPTTPLLRWQEAERLPWGVLILFGGGLSLGEAAKATGLSSWLGEQLAFISSAPTLLLVLAIVAMVIFLTEITSNVATMTALAPILGTMSAASGHEAAALLAPAALAASCAFMLPVATAPNAIVFASGEVTIKQMMGKGFQINLIGIVMITLLGTYLIPAII